MVYGSLSIGTRAAPFHSTATIVFSGNLTDPQLAIDANTLAGNKALIVLGSVTMVAPPPQTTWIRLASAASAGAVSLSMSSALGLEWSVGDALVLGSTSYNTAETETASIASISPDRKTIGLSGPLSFSHFAGPAGTSPALSKVSFAGAVGRLSRSISLRAALNAPSDDYGMHVLVTSTVIGGGYAGSLDMCGVELRSCGKYLNDHACVHVQYGGWALSPGAPPSHPPVTLEAVSVSPALYYSVRAMSATGITIKNSVLMGGYPNMIDFDNASPGASITGNLLVGPLLRPPQYTVGQLVWFRPTSAMYLTSPKPGVVSGNFVQGALDAAYSLFPDSCSAAPAIRNNEAAGGRIGVFVLNNPLAAPPACVALSGFKLWAHSHAAIVAVDFLSSIVISNSVISDSHIGIVTNFVRDDKVGLTSTTITNCSIFGTTAVSGGSTGLLNSVCSAMSEGDPTGVSCGSVLGVSYKRAGFLIPIYSSAAKTCGVNGLLNPCRPLNTPVRACSMPWEKRCE